MPYHNEICVYGVSPQHVNILEALSERPCHHPIRLHRGFPERTAPIWRGAPRLWRDLRLEVRHHVRGQGRCLWRG